MAHARLRKDSKIAVIGGGISGLSFAQSMKERGFTDVVVFERSPRVGGKSCTVEIGGRPHDLGATMGLPLDYRQVLRYTRLAGRRVLRFPRQRHYSLERGGLRELNRWSELPTVLAQAAKYLLLHALVWRGADGTGLHRAPRILFEPWSKVVERYGLEDVSRRLLTFRTGYGYGYDDRVPAVLYANLLRPQVFLGLLGGPPFLWDGGTQPIWEALGRTLDVRTGVSVQRVTRDSGGVRLETKEGEARFDKVVITLDPREALALLDASEEERAMFSPVISYPYATFAGEVEGLHEGETAVGYLAENMLESREGHPMAWIKRYAEQRVFVFHLFAPARLTDEQVAERIAGDMSRLGGRLKQVHASRRWSFFPHFTSEFMLAGGLARIARWQGRTNAYLIGEAFSFASMPRVAGLASDLARRLAREAGG